MSGWGHSQSTDNHPQRCCRRLWLSVSDAVAEEDQSSTGNNGKSDTGIKQWPISNLLDMQQFDQIGTVATFLQNEDIVTEV